MNISSIKIMGCTNSKNFIEEEERRIEIEYKRRLRISEIDTLFSEIKDYAKKIRYLRQHNSRMRFLIKYGKYPSTLDFDYSYGSEDPGYYKYKFSAENLSHNEMNKEILNINRKK